MWEWSVEGYYRWQRSIFDYLNGAELVINPIVETQLNRGAWFRTNIDKPHTVNIVLNFQNDRHNAVSLTFVYSTDRPYTAPVSF